MSGTKLKRPIVGNSDTSHTSGAMDDSADAFAQNCDGSKKLLLFRIKVRFAGPLIFHYSWPNNMYFRYDKVATLLVRSFVCSYTIDARSF